MSAVVYLLAFSKVTVSIFGINKRALEVKFQVSGFINNI